MFDYSFKFISERKNRCLEKKIWNKFVKFVKVQWYLVFIILHNVKQFHELTNVSSDETYGNIS